MRYTPESHGIPLFSSWHIHLALLNAKSAHSEQAVCCLSIQSAQPHH